MIQQLIAEVALWTLLHLLSSLRLLNFWTPTKSPTIQQLEDDGGMEDELVSLQRKIMDLESKLNYGSTN